MRNRISMLILGLAALLFVCGSTGGCAGAIKETNTYYYPNWLPDGRIICMRSWDKQKELAPGKWETIERKYYVTTMTDTGSSEQDLFEVASTIKEITCSPTGEMIAYITQSDGTITVSNYTGTSQTTLSGIASAEYVDWSPDATQLVYSNSDNELHVVNSDGTGNAQIATSAEAVAWRVGEKIVYEGLVNLATYLFTIDQDGTGKNQLTISGLFPQIMLSNLIVYRGIGTSVQSAFLTGTGEATLISDYEQTSLKLSFDNSKIVGGEFDQTGIKDIYVINIDGTNDEQLR